MRFHESWHKSTRYQKINKVVVAVNIPEVRGVSPEDEKKEGFVDTPEVRE